MSTISIWSARRTISSGMVSRCSTPLICCTTSLSDSRCWMLTVVMTSMPASSSSSTSCQRFSCRLPGHVGVGELVDQGDRGPAGQHGVEVELLERRAAVAHRLARHDLEPLEPLGGVGAAVRLDDRRPRRRSRDPAAAAPRRAWRTSCPRPAPCRGRRADIRGSCTRSSSRGLRQGEVELQHVDPGLAQEAEGAALGVVVDEPLHLVGAQPAGPAPRGRPGCRRTPARCRGPGPSALEVTASGGTSPGATPSSFATAARAAAIALARSGEFGPEVGAARGQGVVRRRRRAASGTTGLPVNSWPISDEPTSLPCDLDQRAVGLVVEGDLADARHQQRVARGRAPR